MVFVVKHSRRQSYSVSSTSDGADRSETEPTSWLRSNSDLDVRHVDEVIESVDILPYPLLERSSEVEAPQVLAHDARIWIESFPAVDVQSHSGDVVTIESDEDDYSEGYEAYSADVQVGSWVSHDHDQGGNWPAIALVLPEIDCDRGFMDDWFSV